MNLKAHIRDMVAKKDHDGVRKFIDENCSILLTSFKWLDVELKKDRKHKFALRKYLWEAVVEKGAKNPQTVQALLECAQDARSLAWEAKFADLLEAMPQKTEDMIALQRWCMIGETRLQQGDVDHAIRCFAAAEQINPEYTRAIAGRMAAQLDGGNLSKARNLAKKLVSRFRKQPEIAHFIDQSSKWWVENRPPARTIEIAVFCHVTNKTVKRAEFAPPSIGLVRTAVSSIRDNLNFDPKTKVTVYFDSRETPLDEEFRSNLLAWCVPQGVGVVTNVRNGLRRQWLDAFARATADVVAVVEQDHEFLERCPDVSEVLAVFQRRPDVNYIKLNRKENISEGIGQLLFEAPLDIADNICRTSHFSNTPHLQRRDFYAKIVHPLIVDNTVEDYQNDGAGGVEGNINQFVKDVAWIIGEPATARLLGCAVWGSIGTEASVMSTASRKFAHTPLTEIVGI